MNQEEKLLGDYSDVEKGAYISAIASIASADRSASEEELDFLEELADASDLSPEQRMRVKSAAVNTSDDELRNSLDVLKTSDLKFSLLADLVAFAESDAEYSDTERSAIQAIAGYLGISSEQVSTINEFVHTAATKEVNEEEMEKQGFLGSLGFDEKFKKAGINSGGMMKGLLGFAGPMILGALLSRGLGGRRGSGIGGMLGGLAGGGLGGMLGGGGLGGMLGGQQMGGTPGGMGGLGSIIGMLNGGRGVKNAGGMLGRMFGR